MFQQGLPSDQPVNWSSRLAWAETKQRTTEHFCPNVLIGWVNKDTFLSALPTINKAVYSFRFLVKHTDLSPSQRLTGFVLVFMECLPPEVVCCEAWVGGWSSALPVLLRRDRRWAGHCGKKTGPQAPSSQVQIHWYLFLGNIANLCLHLN